MSSTAAKKPAIKSSKVSSFAFANSGLSDDQAKKTWDALKRAIEEIQNGNASKLRFEELYRNAYTLVLHKHGDLLYNGVTECVSSKLGSISATVAAASNDSLLEVIVGQWDYHKLVMTMIRDILMYMDKTYCKQQKKTLVYDMGLLLFRDHVVKHSAVNKRLKQILLDNVRKEREGEVIDRLLMKNCLSMLVEVNVTSTEVYQDVFEAEFLEQSRQFYQQESQEFISNNTVPDYLRKIEQRLRQEESRADNYLDKSSKSKLRAVVQDELIVKYAKRLVDNDQTGCTPMFTQNLTDDLARMYNLFSREPSTLDQLREAMATLVKTTGTAIVKDKENLKNPKLFVQHVLDARAKFHNFVTVSFKQDRNFARSLKEGLEFFINLDSRAAQYLSLYIDDMLRMRIQGVPANDIDARLNNVISIFRYLQDKDVFEDFYKQHLAGRLLTGQSVNADVEKAMIAKLKAECGHQFTSRLEGMFKDMESSRDLIKGFNSYKSKNGIKSTELGVTVLTTGFWPISSVPDCVLPKQAAAACQHFQSYYTGVHSGRRLTWQSNLGTAELKASFEKGKKELLVHTYQMCILMLYNHGDKFSYAEIQKSTNIPELELNRHLLSLAHPKVRILKKTPNNKTIASDHIFEYNTQYTSKLFRVKIPLLSARASGEGESDQPAVQEPVPTAVLEARKNRVEAAIVRIMKARKTLDHNNLMAEVVKQLQTRFGAEPSFIKKRIESLIEREYIARDKDNRTLYHYLA